MKKVLKITALILALITLFAAVPFAVSADDAEEFWIEPEYNPGLTDSIRIFTDRTGEMYAFLPSNFASEEVTITSSSELFEASGDDFISADFDNGTVVCRAYNGATVSVNQYDIKIMKGSLPVMNVHVGSGYTLNMIHRSRDERIIVTVGISGTDEGKYDLASTSAEMKTRGYSTFSYSKKPYQIKFDKKTDLFGMGKAKKWVLLANYIDGTAVRNKLIFDLGDEIGCRYASKSVFIDLYIDGNYYGVYQLTEKVEIGSSRVDLNDEFGVLIELDMVERLEADDIFFVTSSGKAAVFKDSVADLEELISRGDYLKSNEIMSFYMDYFDEFELLLYDESTTWDQIAGMIDVDSFVRYYLITEFSEEVDATFASTFFYMDGKDDVLHCDPLWDYDRCFGWSINYEHGERADFFKNITVSTDNLRIEWFKQLFRYDEFIDRVNEIYDDCAKAAFNADKVENMIYSYQEEMWDSLMMNYQRWFYIFLNVNVTADEAIPKSTNEVRVGYVTDFVIDWIRERSEFLESAYGRGMPVLRYATLERGGGESKGYTSGCFTDPLTIAGLKLRIEDGEDVPDGGVEYYVTYASDEYGPARDGEEIKTPNQFAMGVKAKLTGNIANYYSLEYKVQRNNNGVTGWSRDGVLAGARSGSFNSYGIKSVEFRLVRKKPIERADISAETMGSATVYTGIVGDAAQIPAPYVRGYRFAGWYDNAEFLGDPVTDPVYGETTELYAKMTEKSIVPGDANCDGRVDMRDVLAVRKAILHVIQYSDIDFDNADMNADGSIDMRDVLAIRKKILGIS
ncbi:MAG: CotH kinase family protein [Clostridia bacterium]|nr:CotH kinase family protein [Clostridia bacterium]